MGWFQGFDAAAQQRAAMEQAAALQQQVTAAWGQAIAGVSDPDTLAFLQLPAAEQARQQQRLQEYGEHVRQLWEQGLDVEVTVQALAATGTMLAGQREYDVVADVAAPGSAPRRVTVRQVIPAATFPQYVVGGRHRGKAAPGAPDVVAIFERIG